jgi:hypothetical protein
MMKRDIGELGRFLGVFVDVRFSALYSRALFALTSRSHEGSLRTGVYGSICAWALSGYCAHRPSANTALDELNRL